MTVVELLALLNKQGIALSAEGGELRISAPKGSLTDELRGRLVEHKRELLELLRNKSAETIRIPRLDSTTRQGNLPLSFAQERLWFLDQLDEGSPVYNIPWAMRLQGDIDTAALQRAVDRLLQRHESLRTGFYTIRQTPTQRIADIASLPIRHEQLHAANAPDLSQRLTALTHLPFDLRQPPLLRVHLLAASQREHILLLVIHHIIADGWSMGVLLRDLADLYATEVQRAAVALPDLDIQYSDFAVWQRTELSGARLHTELDYWRDALAGAPTLLELPADRARPAAPSYRGNWVTDVFPPTLLKKLQALALKRGTTLYMLLLAAFNVLLWRYTRQDDLLVGTPVAGRQQTETEKLLGLFVNSVIIRSKLQPEMQFTDLLTAVSNTTLDALNHQELPFEKLVTELQQDRHPGIAPLFQVMFNLQNREQELVNFAGLVSSAVVVETRTAKFDLNVLMEDRQDGLAAWFEYSTDLFRHETIERMLRHFRLLLEAVAEQPEQRLIELTLLDATEQQRILHVWNNTRVNYPGDATLITLFEQQVERTPDALALQLDYQALTYRELNQRANQLAHYLRSVGVGPESLVGVCMERSLELVISLYGILKAGGAYVPLDPEYPQERLAHMLQDAAVATLLCQARLTDLLPAHQARTIKLDADWDKLGISAAPCSNPALAARPDNAAYVIFTSGSTGRPKGVVNEHRGICNRLLWMQDEYRLNATDRILQKTPFSFDVSVWEFFWPLQTGASLIIAEPGGHRDTAYLAGLIRSERITTLHFVPSMLRSFLEDPAAGNCPALRRVFCSGEALASDLTERFFSRFDAELHNLYGPTEAAVDVTYWQCLHDTHGASVPIGRPVANTSIYIVDEGGALLPAGLPGELWIGGVQVARGYINRPELTAERFIPDPFATHAGARVYRTGDLARYRDDGAIEFLGRIDFQVKLRGFRIELGEIEAELRQCTGVQQAAVLLREDRPGDQRLVAYVVGAGIPAAASLREQLEQRLPDYMVPAAFIQLDELPLTASGKLDRNALPAPDWNLYRTQDYVAARSPVEEALCEIWSDLLGIERVGIHDDFFALGGHSLLATRVVARIRETLNSELPLKTLFDHPTIARIAKQLAETSGEAASTPLAPRPASEPTPLSASQQRLWILDQMEPGNVVYNIPWALRLRGPVNAAALQTAIDQLTARHESLRTRFIASAGEPSQEVLPAVQLKLQQFDLGNAEPDRVRAELTRLTQTPFDLNQLPLLQFTLLRLSEAEHILHIVMHHIIGDAWSTDVLLRDLAEFYNAACANTVAELPLLPVQFGDYATWQRKRLQEPALQRQLDYWVTQLKGAPAVLDLPTDRPRPAVQTYNGAWHELRLDAATTKAIKALARDQSATLYMVLLAAFDVLLQRYSGQHDIVIGTPIAGRQRTELDNLIGMFINTLCLRIQSDDNPQFIELLQQVKQKALDAYASQEAPFEKLVEELHLVRDTSYAPLFQVMFILQNAPVTQSLFTQLESEPVLFEFGTAKLDLTVSMEEQNGELIAYFEYNTDLFDADTIARMATHFATLLQQLAAKPESRVDEVALLDGSEREQILVTWNATQSAYDTESTLHGLFEQSFENHPDTTALVYRDLRLSYRAVEQRANQLAHRLVALGARSSAPIAVSLRRSDEMLVALLGILKTGSAYVPLDPDFPADRLRYMLEDCGANILVSESELTGIAAGLDIKCVCLDQRDPQRDAWPDTPPNVFLDAGSLAYIIYTSGSTGKPKGVAISHRSVVNFLLSMLKEPGISHTDRWLAVTTLSFDISILELFGPLAAGATVVLADRTTTADGFALGRLLEQERITVMQATPATWRMLLQTGWRGDQQLKILCGGEALDLALARQLVAAGSSLWNMYGPTETTIWSTCERINADNSLITVGRPIANTACYILDERQQPVPTGVAGELYIGGDGVAQGYLNRATLTREKFVADPFAPHPGARMYRTGDLARHLPDGRLVVLGRTDFQVKLRGFRIELGEIEAQLAAQTGVNQAVVILREDNPGDQRLVAYLTGDTADDETLRSNLRGNLPDYMVPSAYVRLDTLPLTPNGKVDRKQLPAPEWSAQHEYVAPRNELEQSLAEIWAEVLGLEKVGVYDDFFALGGHSLLATRLISRILDVLDIEIPLMTLFNQPTIDALAVALAGKEKTGQQSAIRRLPRSGKLPLSFAQQRLWFLDELSPGDPTYNIPWVMRLRGEPDRRALQKALDQVIARHESLRTIFPSRDGEPVQVILPQVYVAIREEDFRGQDGAAVQTRLTELAQQRMHIAEGPLIYVTLVRTGDNDYLLALVVHHIIFDAWSHGVLLNELAALYNAGVSGKKVVLAPLKIEFADYAGWQREWFGSDDFRQQLHYWKSKLADAPYTLDLPTDYPRPPVQTSNGANIARMLPDELSAGIMALAEREDCSLFMVLLAAFNVLMSRYSGQDDLLVGTPISGRKRTELEKIVGFFLHTLVIRADLSGNPSFREFLARTRQTVLEAFAHQEMPFETLVEALEPERDTSRHPLFQVHFVLQHVKIDWEMFEGLHAEPVEFEFGTAKFDIMFFVFEVENTLSVRIEYNTDLFEAETIRSMIDHFETLLKGAIAEPLRSVGELPILTQAERHKLLVEWNATDFDYPAGGTMHGYFERQVSNQPDAPALLAGTTSLTYRELNRRANKLAYQLRELGVGPEVMVAICSERSAELIIAMLAVQKAGGAYVPLDPEYPPQRVTHMLTDSNAPVLLTQTALLERLPAHSATTLCLDEFDWQTSSLHDANPVSGVRDHNLGYTIYTSGSTGLPKGVEIEHRNAVALIEWAGQVFRREEFAGVLASTSVCFDLSVFEIFCPLGLGGRVVLVKDALALPELPADAGVTLINSVPSAMAELLRIKGVPASVKTVNLAGEPLSTALVNSIYALGTVNQVNDLYGPSEDTTYSTWTRREANALPTIGRPIYNTQAYLLDAHRQPVPIGVAGELYLGGAGVTRGYRNRSQLTAERYVANPFNSAAGKNRLYRTGDKVRYRRDGNMEFLGRLDHQVKLRGFRIELGEIETALASHPAVENTVVMAREDREGDKRLVAYIVASTQGLEGAELQKWENEQVNQWQDLWQAAYSDDSEAENLAYDFKGWNSSYSGEPIPEEQMRAWLDYTTANIRALHPDRVLEIGSGTGLIVGQIAPACSSYTATDFSAASISTLEKLRAANPALKNLALRQCTADKIGEFGTSDFDTVILNSVAQYFPDIDYLLHFLRDATTVVSDGGHIFLGDLRSLPLLTAYHTSVQLYQAKDALTLPELAELVRQRTEIEEELLIDPAFFVALKTELPRITGIRFSLKRSRYRNELTRFRYDVALRIGGAASQAATPDHLNWNSAKLDMDALEQRLQSIPANGLLISAIPDARLQTERRALERLEHAEDGTVADLRQELAKAPAGIEAEDLYALAERLFLDLQLSGGLPGEYTAVFRRGPAIHFDGERMHSVRPVPWRDYGNDPLQGRLQRSLVPILRDRLYEALPEYMVPSAFVILDAFPLTPNGKINRKALPAPERKRSEQQVYVAPRTPAEEQLAQIWSDILGVKQIGVYDDFFALGGHSLLATQLISRIRDRMQSELPLITLFNHPTIAGLAASITEGNSHPASSPITLRDPNQPPALSFGQQRLWFLDQFEDIHATYSITLALHFDQPLDRNALQHALDQLVARHETLRTRFTAANGKPLAVIDQTSNVRLDSVRVSQSGRLQETLETLARQPFDLANGPLLRVHTLDTDDGQILLIVMHHIISDGWSVDILANELAQLYAAVLNGSQINLPALPLQYSDFASWQREWLESDELQRQLDYWRRQLAGAPPLTELPTDYPRPPVQTFNGTVISRMLSPEIGSKLSSIAKANSTTLFMLLLAAFNVLIQRYSRENDIVIGTPIAGRNRSELEGLIGFFVNTLAIRNDLSGNLTFLDLLAQVRQNTTQAFMNQDVPFEKLVEDLRPARDTSHSPIFQVLFAMQQLLVEPVEFGSSKALPIEIETNSAKFDLSLFVGEFPDGLKVSVEYNTSLFRRDTIEHMLQHFQLLLEAVVEDPDKRLVELQLLDATERARILDVWNDTRVDYPTDATLVTLFEQQVERTPDAVALQFAAETLSYRELNERANQLAHYLRSVGVGPESFVGVCMERSLELVISLYGILKAGAAYVPLDPDYPQERLAYMLQDAAIETLLCQDRLSHLLPVHNAATIKLDSDWDTLAIDAAPRVNPAPAAQPDNAAYLIFTSGSTGRPKGVVNEHRGICNRLLWMQDEYQLNTADRVLQKTPFSFDVSVWEFFWPLQTGASLIIAKPGGHRDAAYLGDVIRNAGITTLHFVPSMLRSFLENPTDHAYPQVKRVFCSGEALTSDLVERFFSSFDAELHNLYGPTEAAVDVTYWQCQRDTFGTTVPIGRPVANTHVYIVDENGALLPPGLPGELWIGGVQVARGYLNRPELTAERFIPDPFAMTANARVYRTGDLARYRNDGVIEFLGRIDFQVKLRGFRIELGEIEAELQRCDGVQQAVVILREDKSGDQRLVAYLVGSALATDTELREQLGQRLPDYMVPSAFLRLDVLPFTASGKLDRNALPAPDWSTFRALVYVAPRTPVERILTSAWADVLGLEQVGLHDDFFELGGHSLLATQLISRVRDALDIDVPLITLFNHPSPERFAAAIANLNGKALDGITKCDRSQPLPLSFAQQRLWFLDQLEPGNPVYNLPWAMRLRGSLNIRALQAAIDDLVARHETLRTLFLVTMGKPQQCILARTQVPIESIDATGDTEAQIEIRLRNLSRMPFSLTQTPLMRVHVLHVANQEHVILLVLHHIISDGWSLSVLYQELAKLYAGHCTGKPASLPALPVQYADYSVWQHAWFRSSEQQRQLQYWKDKLSGAPEILDLPTDRPRGASQTYNGAFIEQVLPDAIHQGLKALAQSENSTLFMVCLAAFNVLLSRYSGQTDFCVGIPIAGRKQTELEGLIGFFINTLVLRADLSGNPEFAEFLASTKHVALEAFAHQELPFEKLVDEIHPVRDMSHAPLFQVAFIFQNTPWDQSATLHGLEVSPIELDYGVAKFDLSLVMAERREGLLLHFEYNTDLFDRETIERLTGHFETLLLAIVSDSRMRVSELPLLTASERQRILFDWNDTAAPYADQSCIHTLIEQRTAKQPDALAILFEDTTVSYRELNERANQIAHYLLAKGAGPGMIIGLCIERSVDLVAGLLGIFKSGAAYVPLDPNYPSDRLEYMLADSAAPLLLSQSQLLHKLPAHSAEVICLDTDWPAIARHSIENPATRATASDLAYVIYTSGSTGKPKGVMIEHRGVCNLADAQSRCFGLGPNDRMLQFASISFDASIFEIVMGLQVGAAMVLAPQDDLLPGEPLLQVLRRHAVTAVTLPPTALTQLPSDELPALHTITVAGEACPPELVQQWGRRRRFFNLYGPTESTVWASYQLCKPGEPVTIGRPISNARLYILDQYQQAVPVGVAGELCIGGAGLARGYLHRPELTAEKFLPDPFRSEADARIYRSGDLVRYRRDGSIEFLGRIDHQVKVRGFRIELGEIETTLAARDDIREAVVVARGDSLQDRRLVAYIIPQGDRELSLSELRSYLKESLPEFMIPGAFVVLDAFPLTPNGKVDRQALPSPDEQRMAIEVEFIAPRSPIEQSLANIWQQLLNVERVGINDNFFELGGDSILSIQIIARAAQAGIRLTPKQLFQHQTIAELALEAGSEIVAAEQGMLTGPVALTPIQHWFVQRELSAPWHFNQSMLLESSVAIDASKLEKALHALLLHHDALRLRLIRTASGWSQTMAAVDETQALLQIADVTDLPPAEQNAAWDKAAEQLQAGFDLANGPLLRAVLFRRGSGTPEQLLIAAHHIAVDWVSWNILLEDLQTAYGQFSSNQTLQLPAKTSSFRAWSEHLQSHARAPQLLQQRDYWLAQDLHNTAVLPRDHANGANTESSARAVTVELPAEPTTVLLQELPRTWRSRINEALLAAVLRAANNWTGADSIAVNLEGHGREELFDDIDLSRTVGWFTSLYPVRLQTNAGDNPAQTLLAVRNTLRGIPDNGIGYGILRYLSTEGLPPAAAPEIGFNYLGQFDQLTTGDALLRTSHGYRGHEQSPTAVRPHVLDIQSVITGGQLQVSLIYSENLHTQTTMTKLAGNLLAELRTLADFCRLNVPTAYSPADFPLAQLDQATLDRIIPAGERVDDIYRVTSLQHGMLFHSLFTGEKDVYFARFSWRLSGTIDRAAFAEAWQQVVNRHTSLRTSFFWEGLREPVQIVHSRQPVTLHFEDWSTVSAEQQAQRLQEFLARDQLERFDFTHAPLLRLVLIKLGESDHRFIWSFHHAIIDGWSVPLVLKDVFRIYTALRHGMPTQLPEPRPFSDYIVWLNQQDGTAARRFWSELMRGFTAPTPLPGARAQVIAKGDVEEFAELQARLPAATVRRLRAISQQQRLTLNTVVQGAWALLLSRYSGEADVVFGATTSGRPAAMPGVESMIGLFLNTLPLRAQVDPAANLLEWLHKLQTLQLEVRQYEYASLVEIQGWSDVPRGTPMFESLLAFENYPEMETMWTSTESISIREVEGFDRTNFPLTVNVAVFDEMHMRIAYAQERFDAVTMHRLVEHFMALLSGIAEQPERALAELPMLTAAEVALLNNWNETKRDYPRDVTLVSLCEQQVAATPGAIAVAYETERLTYAELNGRANQLARYLLKQGIAPDAPVGVCLERSLDLVVTLLGILKAGGAYVPLDPEYPAERLAHMLEDAHVNLLITQPELAGSLPTHSAKTIVLSDQRAAIAQLDDSNLPATAKPEDLAYIIFTSGSTGRPKGVMNEHHGICNRLLWMQEEYKLTADDRVLQKTPFSFDVSVWEFFWPLISGARLVLAAPGGHRDTAYLARLIGSAGITTLHFVPPMLQVFLQDPHAATCTSIRRAICSGEALPYELQERFFGTFAAAELHNLYGPTEAAVDVTYWACQRDTADRTVPIGRPVANTLLYIVDGGGKRVPIDVPGELWIGGEQVARGYINRPELTAASFIADPFSTKPGARVYRTGDLVRWRADGAIEFLGRIDHQVKLRGFRIELGEIEAQLDALPGISQSVVLLREDVPGLRQLVAYVIAAEGQILNAEQLRTALGKELPDYMVPATFVMMDRFPLSPNGKLDRKALPAPETPASGSVYTAPESPLEKQLATMWAELLGTEKVGIHDDFFALGGHSLVAMQLVSRIMAAMQIELPLDALFNAPTIAGLARRIDESAGKPQDDSAGSIRAISRTARRTRKPR